MHPATNPQTIRLSTLCRDAALSSLFRRLEDDGAAEVLPNFTPRRPSPAADELAEEFA